MSSNKWLDVPYAYKDLAKRYGARWSPSERRWFAASPLRRELAQWEGGSNLPKVLEGEDRTFGEGLFVDLVPNSCWFTNVRSCVSETDWDRIRRMVVIRADRKCEICKRPRKKRVERWMEVHERWKYDEASGVQTLARLICLCSDCHRATHYGFAELSGRDGEALQHLMTVEHISKQEAVSRVDEAFELWNVRNRREWTLDIGILENLDITITPPPSSPSKSVRGSRLRNLASGLKDRI